MTAQIPTVEPSKLTAGDTAKWKKSFPDYPAGDWTLSYVLINSAQKYTITATASGTDHLVNVAAATTAAYVAGIYRWQAYLTGPGSERITIETGEIEILANYTASSAFETRSIVKQTLDAIEAVILGRASKDQEEYTIGDRSLKRTPIAELIVLRDKYKALYVSEQNADNIKNGKAPANRIYVRF